MSLTIFTNGPYRFLFFSREEERIHVHVTAAGGEAKFWLDPVVALATSTGLTKQKILRLQKLVVEPEQEIRDAWKKHFKA